ncbi:MAG: UDP-N-acetylmuramoyl-L-alanyl-D-glutamate--2,6-diaminopimelate ligase [bacterium]
MIMKKILKKIIPKFIFSWYHWMLAFLGAVVYSFPSKELKIIGVTGTNGKSTVVYLVSRILESAGYKTAAVSSIQFKVGDNIWDNDLKMTMPGRLKIQQFIRQAVDEDCKYLVLEVTSEGIKQYRHKFIKFNTAVLTNITPEHIESHGSFEKYKEAKGKLFKTLGFKGKSIINIDDVNAEYFLGFDKPKQWSYGIDSKAVIRAKDIQLDNKGTSFMLDNVEINTNLLGKFNIYNTLAAITVGVSEDISLTKIKSALTEILGIPGRLEIVIRESFTVIADYAHTPDALEKVYQTLRKVFDGRLISVLGSAGGGRDKWKRPEMGKIAEKYCDEIIITNEDPYDENPQTIVDEVASGVIDKKIEKIIDRREAIKKALQLAKEGDIVIITGKGCEPWMCVDRGEKIKWDDREIIKEEFSRL